MNARKELLGGLAAIILSAWIVLGSFSIALMQTGGIKIAGATGTPTAQPTTPTPLPTVLPGTPSPTTAPTRTPTRTQTLTPPPNCPPPAGWTAYILAPGDTLTQLALHYGTTVNLIMDKNCMAVPNLLPDVIIYLPPLKPTSTPTPLASPTPAVTVTFTQSVKPCGPPAGWITYVVRSGDTLFHLAQLLNITVYQLQLANCLGNSSLIVAGQTIYIPHLLPRTPTLTSIIPSPTRPSSTPAVNNPPALDPIPNLVIPENADKQTVNLSGITAGAPNEHDTLTVTASSSNPGIIPIPTVHYTSPNTSGTITFSPLPNTHGPVTISVTVNDGQPLNNSITRTFTVTVTQVNSPPVANKQTVSIPQDTALSVTLTASDVDGDPLTYIIVTGPAHGSLTGTPPVLTFHPAVGYFGADAFTFKANDGHQDSNIATISITVTQVNQPPVAYDQSVSTNQGSPLAITLTASDPESQPLTDTIESSPAHGALTGTPPNVTYTPAVGYAGQDAFTFKANDGFLDSNIATITISITATNQPPVAYDQSISTPINTPIAIILTATDPENQPLTYHIISPPAHGKLSGLMPNITYTPSADTSGVDSFTFRANDGSLDSNTATLSIKITSSYRFLSAQRGFFSIVNPFIVAMDIPHKPTAL